MPEAGFSYEVQPDGATVVFTNHTVGADSFHWNFGDGDTSLLHSPTHVFDGGGDYTVVLTATNACGAGEDTEVILISSSRDTGVSEYLRV
ncbi:PKD domain-containing protein, partial [Arthrospira platensis SPKY1]|nr:PKD domain-containing protein [Arthrospira platensis SPKY1]